VYSTSPQSWDDADGGSYVVKGPDPGIVVAECIAYRLASFLQISVPLCSLAKIAGQADHYFASRKLNAMRDASPWLRGRARHHMTALATIVVFDIWIANKDRNYGNVLVDQSASGEGVELIAIDFEKAMTLRSRHPMTETPTVRPRDLWPSEDLGRLMEGTPIPQGAVARISQLPTTAVEHAVQAVSFHLGDLYTWGEATVQVLSSRQKRVRALVEEVWR